MSAITYHNMTIEVASAKEAKEKYDAFKTLYDGEVVAVVAGSWKNQRDEYFDLFNRNFQDNKVLRFGSKRLTIENSRGKNPTSSPHLVIQYSELPHT